MENRIENPARSDLLSQIETLSSIYDKYSETIYTRLCKEFHPLAAKCYHSDFWRAIAREITINHRLALELSSSQQLMSRYLESYINEIRTWV